MKPVGGDNYFTERCSGSEAGSLLRLMDFVYHSNLGLRVLKKKISRGGESDYGRSGCPVVAGSNQS